MRPACTDWRPRCRTGGSADRVDFPWSVWAVMEKLRIGKTSIIPSDGTFGPSVKDALAALAAPAK